MLFLMACHDVSIGKPCDAEFVLSEPSLYPYSLTLYIRQNSSLLFGIIGIVFSHLARDISDPTSKFCRQH